MSNLKYDNRADIPAVHVPDIRQADSCNNVGYETFK